MSKPRKSPNAIGGKARAAKLSAKRRQEIASAGGKALWERIRKGELQKAG